MSPSQFGPTPGPNAPHAPQRNPRRTIGFVTIALGIALIVGLPLLAMLLGFGTVSGKDVAPEDKASVLSRWISIAMMGPVVGAIVVAVGTALVLTARRVQAQRPG